MDDKQAQNLKYTILATIVAVIVLVVLKLFVFTQATPQPMVLPIIKTNEINWDVLRTKIFIEDPAFQVKGNFSRDNVLEEEKVGLVVTVEGTLKGLFKYSFDCNNDDKYELETDFLNQKSYTAVGLCSYEKEGAFKAKVKVKPKEEGFAEKTFLLNIEVSSKNQPPLIELCDVNPIKGTTQKSFVFSFVAQAHDPEGGELAFVWDFGDGATSSEQNPSHIYEQAGGYLPKVYVFDQQGARSVCLARSLMALSDFTPFVSSEVILNPGRLYPFSPTNLEPKAITPTTPIIPIIAPITPATTTQP
ncbi:PKD domain-containing protein [Candidatus Parcubacteria bacterium]|nr:PKD domain-containing protein [Candidatus Parcubacteria bacterium]